QLRPGPVGARILDEIAREHGVRKAPQVERAPHPGQQKDRGQYVWPAPPEEARVRSPCPRGRPDTRGHVGDSTLRLGHRAIVPRDHSCETGWGGAHTGCGSVPVVSGEGRLSCSLPRFGARDFVSLPASHGDCARTYRRRPEMKKDSILLIAVLM